MRTSFPVDSHQGNGEQTSLKVLETQLCPETLSEGRPALWVPVVAGRGRSGFLDRLLSACFRLHMPNPRGRVPGLLPVTCPCLTLLVRLLDWAYPVRQGQAGFVGLFCYPILESFLVHDMATLPYILMTLSVNQKVNAPWAVQADSV